MKIRLTYLPIIILLLSSSIALAQKNQETEKMSLDFEKPSSENVFHLININGSINVETHSGNTVEIEIDKRYTGTRKENEDTRRDLKVAHRIEDNHMYVYLEAPGLKIKKEDNYTIRYDMNNWWNDYDYEFEFDFTIKVPNEISVDVSTMNGGRVVVSDIENDVRAKNINGDIELINLHSTTFAKTINGDIDVSYLNQPPTDSYYKTINGDISVYYPINFSADVRFSIMHGDLYTNFDNTRTLPVRVDKANLSKNSRTKYRINSVMPIRFGDGGPEHEFEVLNGDIYIKQKKS